MSRQSKQRKKNAVAKQFSELRKNGGSGPAKTSPAHGKKKTRWNSDDAKKSRLEVLNKGASKTYLEKLKEKKAA